MAKQKTDTTKKVGAPEGNENARKWTIDEARKVFMKALLLSEEEEYDFIGEVAKKIGISRQTFNRLVEYYPELEDDFELLKSNLESNCFGHGKNNKINTAMAIVNLKSNHGWTDRIDTTTKGEEIKTGQTIDLSTLPDDILDKVIEAIDKNED